MTKVVLVRPPSIVSAKTYSGFLTPPIGLAYIAASLRSSGHKVVIVDDCSTDNTYDVAFKLIKNDKHFTLIRNGERGGAMSSSVIGTSAANARDEDVIVKLDGDDWLARTDALSIIKKTYDTKNCLMTHGSYSDYPATNRRALHGFPGGVPRGVWWGPDDVGRR